MTDQWKTKPAIPEGETLDSLGFYIDDKDYIITKLYRKKLENDAAFRRLKYKKLGWDIKTQTLRVINDKKKRKKKIKMKKKMKTAIKI